MVSFQKLIFTFMFIGLIIFSTLYFGALFLQENNAESNFMENELMNNTFSSLQTELDGFRDQSQRQKTLFESENPTSGFGTILLFSIVSSGKVFNSMLIGIFNIIIRLPVVFLGLDSAVVGTLSTMLVLSIIISLWVLYKLGG